MPRAVARPAAAEEPPAPSRRGGAQRRPRRRGAPATDDSTAVALDALRRIVRELRVAAAGGENQTGLSAAQLFVLQQVAATPGLSLTEIAARTMTDRTSVGAVVDRLLAAALVERRPGAADRRRAEIFATRAGTRALAGAPHPPTRRLLDAMASMGKGDRRQLARGLSRLARMMGLADGPAPMLFEDGPGSTRRGRRRSSGGDSSG